MKLTDTQLKNTEVPTECLTSTAVFLQQGDWYLVGFEIIKPSSPIQISGLWLFPTFPTHLGGALKIYHSLAASGDINWGILGMWENLPCPPLQSSGWLSEALYAKKIALADFGHLANTDSAQIIGNTGVHKIKWASPLCIHHVPIYGEVWQHASLT